MRKCFGETHELFPALPASRTLKLTSPIGTTAMVAADRNAFYYRAM